MGNTSSTHSKTFKFFKKNFRDSNEFLASFGDYRILFSYEKSGIRKDSVKINAEFLLSPEGSSRVVIRSPYNSSFKTDVASYKPSFTFFIFFNKEGFHSKRYIDMDSKMKKVITDLERSIFEG